MQRFPHRSTPAAGREYQSSELRGMLPSSQNRVRTRPVMALVGNLASLDHSAYRHAHRLTYSTIPIAEGEKVSRPLSKLMLGDRFHQ